MSEGPTVDFDGAAVLIGGARRLFLVTHVNPDGDAVGSTAALAHLASGWGAEAVCYCPDAVPAAFRFLVGAELFTRDPGLLDAADVVVVIDCSDPWRLGPEHNRILARRERVVLIDHHTDVTPFGGVNVVDPTAAASGVLVYELLGRLGWPVDIPAAEGLYAAIDTDTGGFRYPNTDARCLRVVAELVELGLKTDRVAHRIYESHRFERYRLLGLALRTLERELEGRLALISVTLEMLSQTGAVVEDTEDIVDYARGIEGVEVGAFLREDPGGMVKLSLRSKGGVPVNELARLIGGGGHPCAAGARFEGTLAEARRWVIETVRSALDGGPEG
ncbi:MAG TPA: bifunctional oligoribonuclease/PAP phosphatase NrnA [bacterium]|nr:bifunctional oligoribonuclease/PAP phosphatase NrnA [bacterium]